MYAMTILSSGLTVFEIMQLSTRRFKRQLAKYKLKKQLKKEEQQEDFRYGGHRCDQPPYNFEIYF